MLKFFQTIAQELQAAFEHSNANVCGRQSESVAIPQSAWADVEVVDENGSCLIHRPSKTELSNLRIYPVLHAPDAPELLHDRWLAEVFTTSIVKDPEVAALGRRVMATDGHRHVFRDGYAPGPTLDPHWCVDWDAKSMADAFINTMVSFWEQEPSLLSAEIVAAASTLADRLAALRGLLSNGLIDAKGTHRTSGRFETEKLFRLRRGFVLGRFRRRSSFAAGRCDRFGRRHRFDHAGLSQRLHFDIALALAIAENGFTAEH